MPSRHLKVTSNDDAVLRLALPCSTARMLPPEINQEDFLVHRSNSGRMPFLTPPMTLLVSAGLEPGFPALESTPLPIEARPLPKPVMLSISQCLTVVPHCCKGDAASQWEMAILGVSELRNP